MPWDCLSFFVCLFIYCYLSTGIKIPSMDDGLFHGWWPVTMYRSTLESPGRLHTMYLRLLVFGFCFCFYFLVFFCWFFCLFDTLHCVVGFYDWLEYRISPVMETDIFLFVYVHVNAHEDRCVCLCSCKCSWGRCVDNMAMYVENY